MPRTVSIAVALLGAGLATQAPEFAQQYRQRLGGAIDELKGVVGQFDAEASARGLDRDSGIRRLEENREPLARQRGRAVADAADRLQRLQAQNDAMQQAGSLGRIAALAGNPDPQIARNAFQAYEPAIPTTGEGALVALFGFLASYGLVRLLTLPFRAFARKPAPRRVRP